MTRGVDSVDLTLAGGERVRIRGVRPEDHDMFLAGWERLSPESRFRRFFTPMPQLSESLLEYFTHPDQVDHVAIAAAELGEDGSEGDGLGVARFIRLIERPEAADVAVAVIDDWHGRGLGTALVARLVDLARECDLTLLTADVLDENRAMRAVFDQLGATWTRGEPGARHAEIPL